VNPTLRSGHLLFEVKVSEDGRLKRLVVIPLAVLMAFAKTLLVSFAARRAEGTNPQAEVS
jgi:hypothetical protein